MKSIFENEKPPNTDVMSLTNPNHGNSKIDRQWDYLDRVHDLDVRGVDQLAQQWGFIDNSTGIHFNLITVRWAFLYMLDRNRPGDYCQKPDSKVLCSSCRTRHVVKNFSQSQLQKDSSERQCLGSEGRLWICPHTSFVSSCGPKRPRP